MRIIRPIHVCIYAQEMAQAGLLHSSKDEADRRRRVLSSTAKGRTLFVELADVWGDVRTTLEEIARAGGPRLLDALASMEAALDESGFHQRFRAERRRRRRSEIEIIDFEQRYQADFERLNRVWIEAEFAMEEADRRLLCDPQGTAIDEGGAVVLARHRSSAIVVGTGALLRHQNEGELAKMAVEESYKGLGIGRMIGRALIERGRVLGLERIWLETNSKLRPALGLYRSLGFEPMELDPDSEFARADVRMKLELRSEDRATR